MKANKIFKIIMIILVAVGVVRAIGLRIQHPVQPPQAAYIPQPTLSYEPTAIPQVVEINPIAVFPSGFAPTAAVPPGGVSLQYPAINTTTFTTTLYSGEVEKFVLGQCATDGGYLVDVSPLEGSVNGAHIEQHILPEFDGEIWVDVLSLTLPEQAAPLPVRVELASTVGWPVAFQQTLTISPGDWPGFIIQESARQAGYVIEINPLSPGRVGDQVEKAQVNPEFPPSTWWDVLRLQITPDQSPLQAEVIVYQTPSYLPVATQYELEAEPGVWYGVALGNASDRVVYIVEVTPLINEDNQVERYTVQPEFDGHTWNDVVRVSIPADRPTTTIQVTVYRIDLSQE